MQHCVIKQIRNFGILDGVLGSVFCSIVFCWIIMMMIIVVIVLVIINVVIGGFFWMGFRRFWVYFRDV